MNNKNPVVLITTATKPPSGVYFLQMTNVSARIIAAKAAVYLWATSGIKKIVIADATGHTLLEKVDLELLSACGVEVEQISYFQNANLIVERGKGFGEGLLLHFALQNSSFLQSESHFFKCTGKIYCRNFPEIFAMILREAIQNVFWRDASEATWVDTRFFYTSKDFCEQVILPAYALIDDKTNKTAEHLVQKALEDKLSRGALRRPLLSGFSGSANRPHFDDGLGYLDYNFPCWIN